MVIFFEVPWCRFVLARRLVGKDSSIHIVYPFLKEHDSEVSIGWLVTIKVTGYLRARWLHAKYQKFHIE